MKINCVWCSPCSASRMCDEFIADWDRWSQQNDIRIFVIVGHNRDKRKNDRHWLLSWTTAINRVNAKQRHYAKPDDSQPTQTMLVILMHWHFNLVFSWGHCSSDCRRGRDDNDIVIPLAQILMQIIVRSMARIRTCLSACWVRIDSKLNPWEKPHCHCYRCFRWVCSMPIWFKKKYFFSLFVHKLKFAGIRRNDSARVF